MQQRKEAESAERRNKWTLLLVSIATLAVLAIAALKENTYADWRVFREKYSVILKEMATDDRGELIAGRFETNILQNYLPELGTVDRCITCHTGMDDHRMKDQPEPFKTHPGRYLEIHDPARFGCTVCHQGQGRATETADAHGNVPHWDYPLLETKYIKSTCSKCHSEDELFPPKGLLVRADSGNEPDRAAKLLTVGRELFNEKGCLGCHAVNGRGGTLSLDITFVGEKTTHEFDFSHIDRKEPRKVSYWLKKHYLEPAEVSPGTLMPDPMLNDEEAEALTAYTLSLRHPAAPSYRKRPFTEQTKASSGKELYAAFCSSCHGDDGKEMEVPGISTPALNNIDSLAVADNDYYRHIISSGRSNTKMTSWKTGSGNLTRAEIDRIIDHIRGWEPSGARVGDVNSGRGDPRRGRAYYRGLCAGCHGRKGEGGIGNILNSMTFLAVSSDPFLAETIVHGRPGTAMPSWKNLPAQGISDILAFIRQWQPGAPSLAEVTNSLESHNPRQNTRIGRILFQANCAACHGRNGEGGIGTRLNSPDVLRAVDDEFFYETITKGRPSTAMPAWRHLSADDVGAVITYLRSLQKGKPIDPESPPRLGDYAVGEVYYKTSCLRCHGADGRGGVGPQLANPVLLGSVSDETLFHWISRGRAGTAMKGFIGEEQGPTRLTPDQISDVIAYIRRLGLREERPILRTGVGNPALGAQLFNGSCSSCHGKDGEGASGPQLNNPTFLRSASDGFLAATIILGRTGTAMQSMVHGQEGLGQISPEQIQDVIAHMRLWDFPDTWRKPRLVAEMSERAIASGREKFSSYCSGCHGPGGRGAQEGIQYFAPSLNNPEFLEAASDGFLLATIARGRSRTPMRPFGVGAGGIVSIPSDQINDIVSFIRTWQE